MTNAKRIGVVIPVYNVERYVDEMMQSLTAQSYKNWVACIVDDGSTDKTLELVRRYAQADSRFVVFSQPNRGVSSARNRALEHLLTQCEVDFIAFLDGDDYFSPEIFQKSVDAQTKDNADCVTFGYLKFGKDGEHQPAWWQTERLTLKDRAIYQFYWAFNERSGKFVDFSQNHSHFLCNRLFKANLFDNIRFSSEFSLGEDQDVLLRLLLRVKIMVVIPDVGLYYRQRKSSACHASRNREHLPELYWVFKSVYMDFEEVAFFSERLLSNMLSMLKHSYFACILESDSNVEELKLIRKEVDCFSKGTIKERLSKRDKRHLRYFCYPKLLLRPYVSFRKIRKEKKEKSQQNNGKLFD